MSDFFGDGLPPEARSCFDELGGYASSNTPHYSQRIANVDLLGVYGEEFTGPELTDEQYDVIFDYCEDLVGELSTRSEEFRTRWAAHNVRLHRSGTKHFHHPAVGDLHLSFDALELPGEPGLTLTAYSAEPGTPSADNLALLASWAATNVEAAPA